MATANSYVQDSTGTYIPATQRPDGSWRKARRVKDGYIPQEEMPLYESKGKQWAKNRPTMPVGLDPCYVAANIQKNSSSKKIPGLSEVNNSDTNVKSTKKKKKKSKKADVINKMADLDISSNSHDVQTVTVTTNNSTKSQPISTDPVKRIRNLKKKLRDIKALKLKIENGELANPDKDQLDKISRQEEIEDEIESLELELGSS